MRCRLRCDRGGIERRGRFRLSERKRRIGQIRQCKSDIVIERGRTTIKVLIIPTAKRVQDFGNSCERTKAMSSDFGLG